MIARLDPTGVIDIGSNSVRMVVYAGTARVPSSLFNEKISPGLGRDIDEDGLLHSHGVERTLAALARFKLLAKDMKLRRLDAVATAAVRDATNGGEFLSAVRRLGITPTVLSGEEEAELAAFGVISGNPSAEGIIADLGGGSLELARVERGEVGARASLPLGVLRNVPHLGRKELRKTIRAAVKGTDLDRGGNLYLVGGSFRALGRLDLHDLDHPLPIVHQHEIDPARLPRLAAIAASGETPLLRYHTRINASRWTVLPAALSVLEALIARFGPKRMTVSAYGLREGILYRNLSPAQRREDPLLAAALEVGELLGRFGDHGATIDRWIDPLFPDDDDDLRRLRLAACLMSDFAWNAHPEFRADRAVDMVLHGNWVGIDAYGRALLGQALCAAFAGDGDPPSSATALLSDGDCERAAAWGRAIRLAQRLSGGTESVLLRTSVRRENGDLVLSAPAKQAALVGEAVAKRLAQLAKSLDLQPRVEPA